MSKGSGVKGFTVDQLRRSKEAAERQAKYDKLTVEEQLARLEKRPGQARKERRRLNNA